MDTSSSHHSASWEELSPRKSSRGSDNAFDLSFMTVLDGLDEGGSDHIVRTPPRKSGKGGIPVDSLPEHLVVLNGSLPPISPIPRLDEEDVHENDDFLVTEEGDSKSVSTEVTSTSTRASSAASGMPTMYEDVEFKKEQGSLILSKERIVFQPHDAVESHEEHARQNPSHSWRWKAIGKHQITPAKSGKIMMKLVSNDSDRRAVTFSFVSREELERVRKDVTRRLRKSRRKSTTTMESSSPVSPLPAPAVVTASVKEEAQQAEGSLDTTLNTTVDTVSRSMLVEEPEGSLDVPKLEDAQTVPKFVLEAISSTEETVETMEDKAEAVHQNAEETTTKFSERLEETKQAAKELGDVPPVSEVQVKVKEELKNGIQVEAKPKELKEEKKVELELKPKSSREEEEPMKATIDKTPTAKEVDEEAQVATEATPLIASASRHVKGDDVLPIHEDSATPRRSDHSLVWTGVAVILILLVIIKVAQLAGPALQASSLLGMEPAEVDHNEEHFHSTAMRYLRDNHHRRS